MNKRNIPILKNIIGRLSKLKQARSFEGSALYWEQRYARGGNSGGGSYDKMAAYKARVLNSFVSDNKISSIIEFGCGDGNQLALSDYPSYIGLDVSVSAIKKCRERFKADNTKSFYLYNSLAFHDNHNLVKAELTLSLDVTYHLIEKEVYDAYLTHLFDASDKYVIIYAWDLDGKHNGHVFHRKFSLWVLQHKKEWELLQVNTDIEKEPSACDFFIYRKKPA